MINNSEVKVRKVIYTPNGFKHGVILPTFAGDIHDAFDYYSKIWFKDHCDKDGELFDFISDEDANSIDEFTIKDDDHFFIGLKNTYAFEGISEDYEGWGCELDNYGFEKMYDMNGNEIPYFDTTV
jgi:hypothetical protein